MVSTTGRQTIQDILPSGKYWMAERLEKAEITHIDQLPGGLIDPSWIDSQIGHQKHVGSGKCCQIADLLNEILGRKNGPEEEGEGEPDEKPEKQADKPWCTYCGKYVEALIEAYGLELPACQACAQKARPKEAPAKPKPLKIPRRILTDRICQMLDFLQRKLPGAVPSVLESWAPDTDWGSIAQHLLYQTSHILSAYAKGEKILELARDWRDGKGGPLTVEELQETGDPTLDPEVSPAQASSTGAPSSTSSPEEGPQEDAPLAEVVKGITLKELTEDFMGVQKDLAARAGELVTAEGELIPEFQAAIEEASDRVDAKLSNCGLWLRFAEKTRDAWKEEKAEDERARKKWDRLVKAFRAYMDACLKKIAAEDGSWKSNHAGLTVSRYDTGKPTITIIDPGDVPARFIKGFEPIWDMDALEKEVKAYPKQQIPGVLVERNYALRVYKGGKP